MIVDQSVRNEHIIMRGSVFPGENDDWKNENKCRVMRKSQTTLINQGFLPFSGEVGPPKIVCRPQKSRPLGAFDLKAFATLKSSFPFVLKLQGCLTC